MWNKILWALYGPYLGHLPVYVITVALLLTAAVRLQRGVRWGRWRMTEGRAYRLLTIGVLFFRLAYAGILTYGQYFVWSQSDFTRLLLDPRIGGFASYFLPYSWVRFWLNPVLSIALALAFWLLLAALRKYRGRFFDQNEVELGMLCALIAGWPNVTIFVILTFFSVVLVSAFRMVFLRERLTTLGWPFILASIGSLLLGNLFLDLFAWGALRI